MLKKYVNLNLSFLSLIEKRLDVILYRSHFVPSVRNAQQLIIHKHIKVNGNTITNKSFTLKQGDLIEINDKVNSLDPKGGIVYTGNAEILKALCPGKFGKIEKQGFCMIGIRN